MNVYVLFHANNFIITYLFAYLCWRPLKYDSLIGNLFQSLRHERGVKYIYFNEFSARASRSKIIYRKNKFKRERTKFPFEFNCYIVKLNLSFKNGCFHKNTFRTILCFFLEQFKCYLTTSSNCWIFCCQIEINSKFIIRTHDE